MSRNRIKVKFEEEMELTLEQLNELRSFSTRDRAASNALQRTVMVLAVEEGYFSSGVTIKVRRHESNMRSQSSMEKLMEMPFGTVLERLAPLLVEGPPKPSAGIVGERRPPPQQMAPTTIPTAVPSALPKRLLLVVFPGVQSVVQELVCQDLQNSNREISLIQVMLADIRASKQLDPPYWGVILLANVAVDRPDNYIGDQKPTELDLSDISRLTGVSSASVFLLLQDKTEQNPRVWPPYNNVGSFQFYPADKQFLTAPHSLICGWLGTLK